MQFIFQEKKNIDKILILKVVSGATTYQIFVILISCFNLTKF